MNKKTIIYIGGFELPDRNAAAQRVIAVGKIFRNLKYNVVYLGIDKTLPPGIEIEKTRTRHFGFDSWSQTYPTSKKQWLEMLVSVKTLKYIVNKYYKDELFAIICYNYPALAQLKVKQLCRQVNCYYIADATEWHGVGGTFLFRVIKRLDTSLRMRYIHFKADGVIATSKFLFDFYNKESGCIVELPTLYDAKKLRSFPEIDRKKEVGVKYFMYAGSAFNIDRINKGRTNIKDRLDYVIYMMNLVFDEGHENFELNIFGLTKDNYLSVFTEHTKILEKLSNKVLFHGRKPHEEIISITKWSDFTIFLRKRDRVIEAGFPSKFSESMSCGTPVVTNKISNVIDFLEDASNGFFIPLENKKEQKRKMIKILSLSDDDIRTMKSYCKENPIFDFNNYQMKVETFLNCLKTKS